MLAVDEMSIIRQIRSTEYQTPLRHVSETADRPSPYRRPRVVTPKSGPGKLGRREIGPLIYGLLIPGLHGTELKIWWNLFHPRLVLENRAFLDWDNLNDGFDQLHVDVHMGFVRKLAWGERVAGG